jgi:uncharacterized membrane protein
MVFDGRLRKPTEGATPLRTQSSESKHDGFLMKRATATADDAVMAEEDNTTRRLLSYSDAVFAVIVTIMVLQLDPPKAARISALFHVWPTFVSYVVSYVFIAIIWINHHHVSRFIQKSSNGLIWVNFAHLFLVSLLPFTTAWMAQTRLAAVPVMVYAGLFVFTDGAYNIYERHILRSAVDLTGVGLRIARRRSLLALALFAAATASAAFEPWVGFGLVCLALLLHVKPDVGSGVNYRLTPPILVNEGQMRYQHENGPSPSTTEPRAHWLERLLSRQQPGL